MQREFVTSWRYPARTYPTFPSTYLSLCVSISVSFCFCLTLCISRSLCVPLCLSLSVCLCIRPSLSLSVCLCLSSLSLCLLSVSVSLVPHSTPPFPPFVLKVEADSPYYNRQRIWAAQVYVCVPLCLAVCLLSLRLILA